MSEKNKWDIFLTLFTNKKDILKRELLLYQNEISTVQQLYNLVVRQLFSRWLDSLQNNNKRDEQQSKNFRETGNVLYKSKPPKLRAAIEFYTKAIYLAPKDSLELSLAHANRAVALMALNLFQEAHDDCELAVPAYPKENILKVLFRQGTCSIELNNRMMLQKAIRQIENELKNHKSRNYYMKILTEYKSKLQNMKKNVNKNRDVAETKGKEINIETSEDRGRYVTSVGSIETDELIMSDQAFAFVPVYERYPDDVIDTDCQNCAKTNIVQFPCVNCHKATYCSIACRLEHLPIHTIECPGYTMNLWYYIGIAHLSLRTFICGFAELVEKLENESDLTLNELWKKTLDLSSSKNFKYGGVLGLVRNFGNMTDTKDFIRYSLSATMLVVYLKEKSQFFDQLPPVCDKIMLNRHNWELFAGALIMMHMGQLVSNGHVITDLRTTLASEFDCTETPPNTVKLGKLHCYVRSVRIFTGLFPRISLLNHSCDANIRNSFHRNRISIHATRPIKAKEEIYNCYGPNYKIMDTADRQQALRDQYCFICKCNKCDQEPEDRTYHQFYICTNCHEKVYIDDERKNFWWRDLDLKPKIDCSQCGQRINFHWYKEFLMNLEQLETEDARIEQSFDNAYKIYLSLDQLMGVHNELRQDIGIMILCHFIPFLLEYKSLNENLTNIAINLLKARESKFGVYSIEFIIGSTYLLDLMAIQRKLNLENLKSNNYYYCIRKSFQILSKDTQDLLNTYIEQYIQIQ